MRWWQEDTSVILSLDLNGYAITKTLVFRMQLAKFRLNIPRNLEKSILIIITQMVNLTTQQIYSWRNIGLAISRKNICSSIHWQKTLRQISYNVNSSSLSLFKLIYYYHNISQPTRCPLAYNVESIFIMHLSLHSHLIFKTTWKSRFRLLWLCWTLYLYKLMLQAVIHQTRETGSKFVLQWTMQNVLWYLIIIVVHSMILVRG